MVHLRRFSASYNWVHCPRHRTAGCAQPGCHAVQSLLSLLDIGYLAVWQSSHAARLSAVRDAVWPAVLLLWTSRPCGPGCGSQCFSTLRRSRAELRCSNCVATWPCSLRAAVMLGLVRRLASQPCLHVICIAALQLSLIVARIAVPQVSGRWSPCSASRRRVAACTASRHGVLSFASLLYGLPLCALQLLSCRQGAAVRPTGAPQRGADRMRLRALQSRLDVAQMRALS